MFTEIPQFTPQNQGGAKCSFCGQHAREMPDGSIARKFRTPTHIHMEGWIEICERCIHEAAVLIGMIDAAQAEELEALLVSERAGNERLNEELEESRASVRVLAQSLATDAEDHAAKVRASYDKGYAQAQADAELEHADA